MGQAVVSVDVFWGPSLQLSLHRGGSNTARELKQPQLSHAMCPCGALAVAPKWAWGGLRGARRVWGRTRGAMQCSHPT